MAAYSNTTLLSALTSLSIRLGDPDHVYWKSSELIQYIIEAIRTWQGYTAYYRDRQTFSSVAEEPFYDLSQAGLLPAGAFDYNITDRDLISTICYQLLEAQLSGGWTWAGTDQFTLAQVVESIQRRRDRFLGETGCVISKVDVATVVSLPSGRIDVPDNIIDIRRAAWITLDSENRHVGSTLWRDDEFAVNAYRAGWTETPEDTPQVYSVAVTPPASMQLAPIPAQQGQIQLCASRTGATLDPTAGVLVGVPDDYAWGIKFGALSDLLMMDGQGTDPERAAYCEKRYQEAVQMAKMNPSILETQLNGIPIYSGSVFDLDAYQDGWQARFARPVFAGMAGRNLLALGDTPDDVYGMSVDLVRNIPVPALTTDYLQIGGEDLDTLLDYAQHLASFKMGGSDFAGSMQLYHNFVIAAAEKNNRIRQAAFYNDALRQNALRQGQAVPRLDVPRSALYEQSVVNPK